MALVYASMFGEIADKMAKPNASAALVWPTAVSYTHLTMPTILLV